MDDSSLDYDFGINYFKNMFPNIEIEKIKNILELA